MVFENPDLLFLLWAIPLQAFLLWVYWRWRQRTLRLLVAPELAQRLLLGFSAARFWFKNVLFGLALVLLVLAIANPRQLVKKAAGTGQGADIVLALDISRSMLARDAAPNRLEQAKLFSQKLLRALEGNRVGLIFFAGEAFPQMPLSTDYEALGVFLQNAGPEFIANQGTAATSAIETAGRMFESNAAAGRALVLISDGENFAENAMAQAQKAHGTGMTVYTVGLGTAEGGTIPLPGGGTKRDAAGKVVRTRMDAAFLRDLARAGGGSMYLADHVSAVKSLASDLNRLQKTAVETKAKTDYVLYFQWLLLPCLLLLLLEQVLWWRKQKSTIKNHTILLLACFFSASTMPAQSAHSQRRAGDRHYGDNKFAEAEQAYGKAVADPEALYNAGIAAFQQGKYEAAVHWFQQAAATPSTVQPDAWHNLGNTYMQLGKYPEAIAAYERSLRRAPNRTDAKKNLQIARNKLRERQEPPPPPPPQRQPPPPPSRNDYVDQARQPQRKETPSGTMTAAAASQILDGTIQQEEIKNARRYRALPPEANPGRAKKDW